MARPGAPAPHSWWRRARVYAVPLAIFLAVALPHIGQGDFRTDTGWYAAIGLSTVRHWAAASGLGDLLTLQAEPGLPFFNKPPLALWIHGVVLHVFGISLAAARLPTIAAACGCIALTTALVKRFGTRSQAMMAGVALALTLEFFRRTKEISLDMWQLLFMLAAVVAAARWSAAQSGKGAARNGAATGALIGLSLLCKPLVGVLASVILMTWLARRLRPSWIVAHLAWMVVVAAPWYLVMFRHHGDAFLKRHFVGEVADRAAGISTAGDAGLSGGGAEPIWFYAQQIGETYWPWLPVSILGMIALARAETAPRTRRVAWLAIMWFGAWLILLSIFPDRRPRYALVLWPAGAILSGVWFGVRAARPLRPLVRAAAAWGVVGSTVVGAGFALLPVTLQKPPHPQWPALFEWMDANHVREVYQGGFSGPSGSRVYLQTGAWPIPTQDRTMTIVHPPPAGAYLLYHRRDGYGPGPGEIVLFEHSDLRVTRLTNGAWRPVRTSDPGEPE